MNDTVYITLKQGDATYTDKAYTKKSLKRLSALLTVALLGTVLVTGLIFVSIFSISYTVSGSMVPTLSVGEISLMRHVFGEGDLKRGDIVMFNPVTEYNKEIADFLGNGEEIYIKRLIGMPGDTIRIENDVVFINGEPLDEPYAAYPAVRVCAVEDRSMDEVIIPEGHYFFMGDNRDNSYDSRYGVGIIPYENIERKVVFHFPSISAHVLGTDNAEKFM